MTKRRIVYLPLDERPCNRLFPHLNFLDVAGVELIAPPSELLGHKKRPADLGRLEDWTGQQAAGADALVVSLEQWVYGGLLPSRLHHLERASLLERIDRLRTLKRRHPGLRLFVFALVMRCPTYDSDDEEPDYWADWGAAIHRHGVLADRSAHDESFGASEAAELAELDARIPRQALTDYHHRRRLNLDILQAMVDAVAEGWIDALTIPQDDTAPWGYSASDKRAIAAAIESRGLADRILSYPGADEAGCTLCARAWNVLAGRSTPLRLLHSHEAGLSVVPRYEGQPIGVSIRQHLMAAGGREATATDSGCAVLALSLPIAATREAPPSAAQAIADSAERRILEDFLSRIASALASGAAVYLADLRFTNGADPWLVEALADRDLLHRLAGYSGWNTCCNALGTVLSQAVVGSSSRTALQYRLLEDWAYMACVRPSFRLDEFPDIDDQSPEAERRRIEIAEHIGRGLAACRDRRLSACFPSGSPEFRVWLPWSRRFEIGLAIDGAIPEEVASSSRRGGVILVR